MKQPQQEREAAVAIAYDYDSGEAPKVIASGYGEIARKILELARESNIHIENNDTLVKLLARVPIGTEIPEQAYQLVAELLAFLYRTDKRLAEKRSSMAATP